MKVGIELGVEVGDQWKTLIADFSPRAEKCDKGVGITGEVPSGASCTMRICRIKMAQGSGNEGHR